MARPSQAPPVRVVLLGTAGGPQWWRDAGPHRIPAGISTAIVVGEDVYLVDAGYGAGGQLARAGLGLSRLRGVFLTHLHSDHVADLPGLLMFASYEMRSNPHAPVPIYGPGDRGMLPPVSPHASTAPEPLYPAEGTPGVAALLDHVGRAFATDLNDRILDGLRARPDALFRACEIPLPEGISYHPNDAPSPEMEPFEIHADENVRVSAILVQHPPVAPAFAFRFDTAAGSITVSGDTAPCTNMVRLARDTDLLLHEAIDEAWLEEIYGGAALGGRDRAGIAHHRRAHTTPSEAGRVATAAGAHTLVLHHLVPGDPHRAGWAQAEDTFSGPVLVPRDLEVLTLPS